jgi:hypothetical protein
MMHRLLKGLLASILLLSLSCKDPDGGTSGGTAGVALYAFDSTTSRVFVWTDLNALYDGTASSAPSYQITSNLFTKVTNLAWGGACLDIQRGMLYLVSDTGDIVRVSRIRSQTGTVATVDVVSFRLASDRLTNGKFGQASLDAQTDSLLITESGDNGTRIWVVPSASNQLQDATVALQALQVSGDTGGRGVAAASGVVYGSMTDGSPVGIDALTGPRLRKGTTSAFDPSLVILGSSTTLGAHGTLALDTAGGYLFAGRHNTDAGSTAAPIMAFRVGQFGLSYNQAPTTTLGSATDQPDLRVLSHAGIKDWLVGLRGQGTTGYGTIFLWKSPLGGTAAKAIAVTPTDSVLKGVAVDGNVS